MSFHFAIKLPISTLQYTIRFCHPYNYKEKQSLNEEFDIIKQIEINNIGKVQLIHNIFLKILKLAINEIYPQNTKKHLKCNNLAPWLGSEGGNCNFVRGGQKKWRNKYTKYLYTLFYYLNKKHYLIKNFNFLRTEPNRFLQFFFVLPYSNKFMLPCPPPLVLQW